MEANNAAMREALKRLLNLAYEVQDANSECEYGPKTSVPTQFLIDVAKSALSAPPRNCDVGNEEEQAQRIDAFCKSHGTDQNGCYRCEECPLLKIDRCELVWAQMPYQEGENEGSK